MKKQATFKVLKGLALALLGYGAMLLFPYLLWIVLLIGPCSGSEPLPKDCPSEAEAKAHFFKHEAEFEELRDLLQTYVRPPSKQVDSLRKLVGCQSCGGNASQVEFVYFQAEWMLGGLEMRYRYIEDIPQTASLRKDLVPLNVDIHQATSPRSNTKLKHIKGGWFLALEYD